MTAKKVLTGQEQRFVKEVWAYYKRHGRRSLPWRHFDRSLPAGRQAYHILVSEVMLQQTQVERVIPKYQAFLKQFPTFKRLAEAPLGDVLRAWQGLGYNRRAKMLHACAKVIVENFRGRTPKMYEKLVSLPGVGQYTAGAIMAFAFNTAIPIIETNIRSVFIHYFYNDATDVTDKEILQCVEHTLDRENPREWYYALMDYGVYIKKEFGNPNSRSKHHAKQSAFKGSDREIRGTILKLLSVNAQTHTQLHKKLSFENIRIDAQLEKLLKEEMVEEKSGRYCLPL
jgi:A/G-specific adenine glycosylase